MTSSTSVANPFLEEGDQSQILLKDVNTKKGKSTICTKKNHRASDIVEKEEGSAVIPSPDDTDFSFDEEENEFESILTSYDNE